jgi:hypothetical protein
MTGKKDEERRPDPERLAALRSLPAEITAGFTKEEVNAFLFAEDWPDSLREKLKKYIVD